MSVATLERRLQLLLDEDRFSRLAEESQRTGRSVSAIIREAIDARLDSDEQRRRAAARFLLSSSDPGPEPGEDWEDMKAAWEQDLIDRLP